MGKITGNPVGAPLKYKTVAELQKAIDKYFTDCDGEIVKDSKGDPLMNKYGDLVYIGKRAPTVTGLAIALGFKSRQALLNYQDKAEFNDAVVRAKTRCEDFAELMLFDKNGANGAKFSLANNFKGWKEKQEVELNANVNVESYLKDCEDDSEF